MKLLQLRLDLQLPVRIVICCEGGSVQAVLTDGDAEVILVDWDDDEQGMLYPHSHISQMDGDVVPAVERALA